MTSVEEAVTAQDIATALNVTRQRIHELIRAGRLTPLRNVSGAVLLFDPNWREEYDRTKRPAGRPRKTRD